MGLLTGIAWTGREWSFALATSAAFPLPPGQQFRIGSRLPLYAAEHRPWEDSSDGGEADPSAAATAYEYRLRQLVGEADERWPRFDLILLGLGEDGHTASLFPGTAAAQEKTRWVTPGSAPTGTRQRLTLTTGVINHAGVVLFLVTGASKAPVARKVLEGGATAAASYPAAAVQPDEGRLLWFLDRSAAADLTASKREFSSEEA